MMFIYLLESNPEFLPRVDRIRKQMEARGDMLVTSVFTMGEVLTRPRRLGASEAVSSIKHFFQSGRIELLPFTAETADRYSVLRAEFKVSQPDAIHLASAAVAGVDVFVTNDRELQRLHVPGITFIVGLDGRVF
jgi:predicted nucleic acid-binding protein